MSTIQHQDQDILEFCQYHATNSTPIALVTSGGTCADLEVRSVRCIDNFSTGRRGARSVEAFLKCGYAVLFLQRKGSASPFVNRFIEYIQGQGQGQGISTGVLDMFDLQKLLPQVQVDSNNRSRSLYLNPEVAHSTALQDTLQNLYSSIQNRRIYTIPFRTVEEYLGLLELTCTILQNTYDSISSASLCCVYLAAAVSDFYIPVEERTLHKIDSRASVDEGEGIQLRLRPVPKVMGHILSRWIPQAFLVSFKLETDTRVLFKKARLAIERYGAHIVVANELYSRQRQVWLMDHHQQQKDDDCEPLMIRTNEQSDIGLEETLVKAIVDRHFGFISERGVSYTAAIALDENWQGKSPSNGCLRHRIQGLYQSKELWKKLLEWSGPVLGALLSYYLSSWMRGRSHRR